MRFFNQDAYPENSFLPFSSTDGEALSFMGV
jgi:hypothetical protein